MIYFKLKNAGSEMDLREYNLYKGLKQNGRRIIAGAKDKSSTNTTELVEKYQ